MNAGSVKCAWWKLGFASLFLLANLPAARAQTAVAQTPFVQSRIVSAVDESNMVTLRGNTHPLARAQYDQGAVGDNQPIHRMQLLLQRSPQQEAALKTLLDDQQSKSTPNYHQWLTPQQFGQQFGPSDADVQAVANWLTSRGFQVDRVSSGKTVIEFSGNAGQVRDAFRTEIHRYVINGQEHFANATDPQIPAALAPVVAGTVSLHNFGRRALYKVGDLVTLPRQTIAPDGTRSSANPLLTVTCGGVTCYAVAPGDFATIYNTQSLWSTSIDGTGQTIAIVGDSNINCADVTNFRNFFSLSVTNPNDCTQSTSNVQVVLNGPDPGITSDELEADLDVEWSGAVAKGAHIYFVTSQDTEASEGVDLSAEYIVDNNLAPVMSESFGDCEADLGNAGNLYYKSLWEQAAAQGITAMVSTGDSGSAGCDNDDTESVAINGLAINGIGSTPYNVAVGGTDFNDASNQTTFWNAQNTNLESAKSYIPEIPWDNSCAASSVTGCGSISISAGAPGLNIVAAGGGQSKCASAQSLCAGYAKPSWQAGNAVTGLAQTDGVRDVPDVSLFSAVGSSSNSFYPICAADLGGLCTNGTFEGVGGTSASSPAFAGIMALVNQYMLNQGQPSRQGNANYVLYSLASNQVTAATSCNSTSSPNTANGGCTFYDITSGSNSVPCVDGTGCSILNPNSNIPGVLEQSSSPAVLGWQAGTGYDLSSGLGSVNAFNLVHNWPGVVGNFKPSTSTLQLCTGSPQVCVQGGSSNTLPLTHGATVTITADVSPTPPNTGTPTGNVTLLGTPDTLSNNSNSTSAGVDYFAGNSGTGVLNLDAIQLNGGTATGTSKYLVGGSYAVTARYPGDGIFGASTSTAVDVSVLPENSTTSVSIQAFDAITGNSTNARTYGLVDVIHVNVVGLSGDQTASGTVAVTDNSSAFGGAGCCTLDTEGVLELQAGVNVVPALSVGSHSFEAAYAGDSSYQASASGTVQLTITQAATTAGLASNQNSVNSGASILLTATIGTDSAGVAPSGTVTFFANNTPISQGTVNYTRTNGSFLKTAVTSGNPASVIATLSATLTATTTFTAMYNADTNYASSPVSSGVTVTVNGSQSTFSIASPNFSTPISIATPGQSGSATVTVGSANGFAGAITVTCSISPTNLTDPPACLFSQNDSSTTTATLSSTTTSVPLALTITTTAASAVAPYAPSSPNALPNAIPYATLIWLAGLLGLATLFALQTIRPEGRRSHALLALLLLVTLATVVSCSSGSSGGSSGGTNPGGGNPGTAAAAYTVTVRATATGLAAQTNTITVNVQ